jgi:thiamine pyrophosphokinase
MKKCALVFTGGKGPVSGFDKSLIPPCSFICAADSGIDTAIALGYEVDEAIGDFDSISGIELLENIAHTRLPKEKDITDTEAILQHITAKGIDSYILVGGGEGRFDHLLHLYTLFATYGPPKLWITARERMYLVKDRSDFTMLPNAPVSIIPTTACGESSVSSENLFWELKNYPISMQQQSISNKCRSDSFSIQVSGNPIFVSIPFP